MQTAFIDAHAHIGQPGALFVPETGVTQLLHLIDHLGIEQTICTDHRSLFEGCAATLPTLREIHQQSNGRLSYLGVYHPGDQDAGLAALHEAVGWPGFRGVKIHPSFHGISADAPAYEPIWRFAADKGHHSGENLRGIAERGLIPLISSPCPSRGAAGFRREDFTYNEDTDSYTGCE